MTMAPILTVVPSVGALPPLTGDWIVTGSETVTAGLYGLNDGNLIIQDGGKLTLDGADIMINDTIPGHIYVEVQDGGELIMKNGATIRLRLLDNYIHFYIRDGAKATITDSFIYDVGNAGLNLPDQGIYINSDDVTIDNTEISRCSNAIIIDDSDPTITNNSIHDNWGYGMVIIGGEPTIKDNAISHNGLAGWSWWGRWWHGIVADNTDARIEGNTITSNGLQPSGGTRNGAGIWVSGGEPQIRNNTIQWNSYYGIHADSLANGLIADNIIEWNENGGIEITDVSDMDVIANTVRSDTAHGIYIDGGSRSFIKENHINVTSTNFQFSAVTVTGMASPVFLDNDIYQWANGDAVSLTGSSSPTFDGNYVYTENGDAFDIWYFVDAKLFGNTIDSDHEAVQVGYFCDIEAQNNDITSRSRQGITVWRYTNFYGNNNQVTSNWEGVQVFDHSNMVLNNTDIYVPTDVGLLAAFRSTVMVKSSTIRSDSFWGVYSSESTIDLVNSSISAPNDIDILVADGQPNYPSLVRTLNTTFNQSDVAFSNNYGTLNVSWYAERIWAEWQNGRSVPDANISIKNILGTTVFNGKASKMGQILWLPVQEYTQDTTGRLDFTRHNFTGEMNGVSGFSGATVNQNVKIRLILQDNFDDPLVNILNPMDGAIFNVSDIIVNGTAMDPQSGIFQVEVTPTGVPVQLANGTDRWTTNFTLADGEYTIDAMATNFAGITEGDSVTITVDTVPPPLDVTYPPVTDLINVSDIVLEGTTEAGAHVNVMGKNVTVDANGDFTINLTLPEGVNNIVVYAHDDALNYAHSYHVVTVDLTPPELVVSNPPEDMLTNNPDLIVTGWTEVDATLTYNSADVNHSGKEAFAVTVNLKEGTNVLTFVATDPAGNTASEVRTVILDTTDPEVEVYNPTQDILTNDPDLDISGTIEDITVVTVTVNGKDVTVDDDGNFSRNVKLKEGMNQIEIIVVDEAGHMTIVRRLVELDTIPPVLEIIEPVDGLLTNDPKLHVIGTTEVGVNVTVNDNGTKVYDDATFEYIFDLWEGPNVLTVVATDPAGNPTVVTLNVTLDTIPPELKVSTPKNGDSSNEYGTDLKGNTEPGAVVTVNGKVVNNRDGKFSIDLALLDGSNKIVVTSTDAAGNVATEELTVTREGLTAAEMGFLSLALLLLVAALVLALLLARKKKKPSQDFVGESEPQYEPMGASTTGPEPGAPAPAGPEPGAPTPAGPEPEGISTESEAQPDSGATTVEDTEPKPEPPPSEPAPETPPEPKNPEGQEAEGEAPPNDSGSEGPKENGDLQSIMDKLK